MDERFSEHVRCTRVDSSCGSTKYLRRRAAVISYKHLWRRVLEKLWKVPSVESPCDTIKNIYGGEFSENPFGIINISREEGIGKIIDWRAVLKA